MGSFFGSCVVFEYCMTVIWGEMMLIRPDNAQHIGAREQQEDAFGFSSFKQTEIIHKRGFAAVLADGMGGMTQGREVSQLAVQSFLSYFHDPTNEEEIPVLLQNALFHVNECVHGYAKENGVQNLVGSTLIAAIVKNQHLYWISVGDSRIYLFRQNELIQLTEDHVYGKVLNEQAALGKITKEEAENDPQRAALTSFIGLEELKEIDQNVIPFPLQVGDRILLCSDGVYGFISEPEISHILQEVQEDVCQVIVNKVLEKRHLYQDNITAILIDCKKEERTVRLNHNAEKSAEQTVILSEEILKPTESFVSAANTTVDKKRTKAHKNRRLPLLFSLILVFFLIMGLAGYLFVVKDANFNEIKNSVLSVFHLNEKSDTTLPKEGDR